MIPNEVIQEAAQVLPGCRIIGIRSHKCKDEALTPMQLASAEKARKLGERRAKEAARKHDKIVQSMTGWMTSVELAKKHGVHKSTIRDALKKNAHAIERRDVLINGRKTALYRRLCQQEAA